MRFRLADVSTRTLAKIATYGAVATIGGLILVRSRLEDRVRQSEFYRLAMKTLRSNPGMLSVCLNLRCFTCPPFQGARLLLGEPMKEHGFDLGDSKLNYCDKTQARFKVSVQGPKDKVRDIINNVCLILFYYKHHFRATCSFGL